MRRIIIILILAVTTVIAILIADSLSSDTAHHSKADDTERLMDLGRKYYRENKHDSAMMMFSIVASRYSPDSRREDIGNAILAMNNIGIIYEYYHMDFTQAYNNFDRALTLANRYNMPYVEAVIYLNLADMFRVYVQSQYSDRYVSKIFDLTQVGFKKALQANEYECMSAILMNQLLFDLSTPTKPFTAIFSPAISDSIRNVAFTRELMKASDLYSRQNYEQARKTLIEAQRLINSQWNPEHYQMELTKLIADTYKAEGNIDMARQYYEKALHQADSTNVIDMQLATLARLSNLRMPQAREYRIIYLEKKDSVTSNGRLAMIGEMDFLRDLKIEQEKTTELRNTKRNLLMWISIGSGVLLLIVVFVILLIRKTARLRESNRALYLRINAQLDSDRPLAASVDDIDDNELPEKDSPDDDVSQPTAKDKYSTSNLTDRRLDEIYDAIAKVLADHDVICSPDFNLSKLASIVNANTSYVSRVINEKYGCSLTSLINDRRIKIACQRLSDVENYGNMTIEAISKSAGFSSRSTFVSAFKKVNGITPSEYLKMAREMNPRK